jgi:hypothetical protein
MATDTTVRPDATHTTQSSTQRAHLALTAALYDGLSRTLGAAPSRTTSAGASTGWTLRVDPLNSRALRFDWIAGTLPRILPTDIAATTTADRGARAALDAATTIATEAGFRVRADGTGLYLTPRR